MARVDDEKTLFTTPVGTYCYVCMPFGLQNAGPTFQRTMRITLQDLQSRNVEAYVDDIVVKTRETDQLVADLEQMFAPLRANRVRLNPKKCIFKVPRGMLLCFIVSQRGIMANL